IIGEGRLGVPIDPSVEGMLARARPEVAVVCTSSDVETLSPTLEACVDHGTHVVTSCENLADPDPALAQLEPGFEQRVRDSGLVRARTGEGGCGAWHLSDRARLSCTARGDHARAHHGPR